MAHANHKLQVCLLPPLIIYDWLETASWEGNDNMVLMMKQVASCLLSAKLGFELNPHMNLQKNLENFREKERKRERRTEKSVRKIRKINQEKIGGDLIFNPSSSAYLGEEDQLRPSGPLLRCGVLLVPSCPFIFVQEELKSCPSQFQDCSLGESRQKMR
ncbi:hypothetical protein IGI04_030376 [Brassica rapa subsp. trilocularis]|uniref:Uncharacterized protein n=1 Tax=Brassica rapa subsp. trilocularis TaxID=1813537 RepID=A0ABQ7LS45_BRACM|nr:hypothetical protein IGI04_030376 [Brassica rapa subsp. trilocularis]